MAPRVPGTKLDVPPLIVPAGNLASVDVYITSQCNRRCSYCFLPADFFDSGARMSFERFSGVVGWSQHNGVGEITLLGGEPSLHPSFPDMISHASGQGLDVRVVTNGARSFQRLLAGGRVGPGNLARVAVSLDSLDEALQDQLRGRGAWQDAMATITLLCDRRVLFDINVTGVRPVLDDLDALIGFADQAGCRRVNVHWPSMMGIGSGLDPGQIPGQAEWEELTRRIGQRVERRPDFFVEVERGFLAEGEPLTNCALADSSNLQIFPDGRAYRCGLLADQEAMASLSMTGSQLLLSRPGRGEHGVLASMPPSCDGCPVMWPESRRACIYDKVRSASP
jgi:MoaA/NifB/PqqE/SkfB family radical SAM enzyme